VFGTTAHVSEVLGGKRALTLEMIRKLHALFGIPLAPLIGAPVTTKRKGAVQSRRSEPPSPEAVQVARR